MKKVTGIRLQGTGIYQISESRFQNSEAGKVSGVRVWKLAIENSMKIVNCKLKINAGGSF